MEYNEIKELIEIFENILCSTNIIKLIIRLIGKNYFNNLKTFKVNLENIINFFRFFKIDKNNY